jgi:hypothetical protein
MNHSPEYFARMRLELALWRWSSYCFFLAALGQAIANYFGACNG